MRKKYVVIIAFVVTMAAVPASAQRLTLVPIKSGSEVRLEYGSRKAVVDLEGELGGTYGSMPGNPPHRFQVLFTTQSKGYLYLVARVRSRSPISNKNAPCGGDAPQSILWIKTDMRLKSRELQSEVFESCSFSYYDSALKRTTSGLVIDFGGGEKRRMTYNNRRPEKGLEIAPL